MYLRSLYTIDKNDSNIYYILTDFNCVYSSQVSRQWSIDRYIKYMHKAINFARSYHCLLMKIQTMSLKRLFCCIKWWKGAFL